MGNIFSSDEEGNSEKYNLVNILKLKERLGYLKYEKKNIDFLNEDFNMKDIKNLNLDSLHLDAGEIKEKLTYILKELEKDLILNYIKDDWINNPLTHELEHLVLKKFNIEHLAIDDKLCDLGETLLSKDSKNTDSNINQDDTNENDVNNKKNDLTDCNSNIRKVYRCNFRFKIKDNLIFNKPEYLHVDLNECYLGKEKDQFRLYTEYDNTKCEDSDFIIDLLFFDLVKDKSIIYFNTISFAEENIINKNLYNKVNDDLFSYLNKALISVENNNTREIQLYCNKFNKNLEKYENEKIIARVGENKENELIKVSDFLSNLDL